jgi:UDP-N-acetylmuramoyl-L-alanyl-D-glutamate--2,6-diaminopimelate ligase
MASDGMLLRILNSAGESFELRTPLVGRHNAYNLLCVIAASRAIGIDNRTIIAALENEPGAPGRLQAVVPQGMKRDDLPFQVFVDYAHTHDSLENVLTALRGTMAAEDRKGRLICVFGCGGDRDRTKRPKMALVAEKNADKVIVTSDNPRTEEPEAIINEIVKGFTETGLVKVLIEADRREAIRNAIAHAEPGDVVLIAGKGHENYQIIGKTKHHFDDVEEATKALMEGALVTRS